MFSKIFKGDRQFTFPHTCDGLVPLGTSWHSNLGHKRSSMRSIDVARCKCSTACAAWCSSALIDRVSSEIEWECWDYMEHNSTLTQYNNKEHAMSLTECLVSSPPDLAKCWKAVTPRGPTAQIMYVRSSVAMSIVLSQLASPAKKS